MRWAIAALLLAACASNEPRVQQDRYHADLSRYDAIRVVVDVRVVKPSQVLDETIADFRRSFIEQIRARGKFTVVEDVAAGKTLEGRLVIHALSAEGTRRRAGYSIEVVLSDPASREALVRMHATLTGRNNQSATTGDLVTEVAKDLADRVSETARR